MATFTENWVAFPTRDYAVLWPLGVPRARVLRLPGRASAVHLAFSPDGRFLLSSHPDRGEVRMWPLSPEVGTASRAYPGVGRFSLDVDAMGRFVAVDNGEGGVTVVPFEGGLPRRFQGEGTAFLARTDADGRRLAAYVDSVGQKPDRVDVWDLETGGRTDLDLSAVEEDCAKGNLMQAHTWGLKFLADGTLLTDGFGGLRVWDLARRTSRLLRACDPASFRGAQDAWHGFVLSRDERLGVRLLSWTDPTAPSKITVLDLAGGNDYEIMTHGNRLWWYAALDPTGQTLVTGDKDGIVRVGPVTGEEPHLLFGHSGKVNDVVVSPDGKWIGSASDDGTIRLWPMPEGPPLHALPYETLLSKLRGLTNLRVVSDPASETGYKLEIGPFPGWADEPKW